ncbi:hypothetical protein [Microvirga yunnanensis]|uniref:hypothetical protein n=1 Tax=Microvirga yunnanensis TaxID=2953740 RepID=UPI0021C8792A|nr:hypothetical protein [Microvirga sp. HBU65207]
MDYRPAETDMALDQKRQGLADRLARETRVGWPTLAAILILIVVGAAIVAYLLVDTVAGP